MVKEIVHPKMIILGLNDLWYSCECVAKTDMEEKKLLNTIFLFVFFEHKKDPCSFIKLRLTHWSHMDYFNDVPTTFLGLERVRSYWISSKISSIVFQRWMKALCLWNDTRASN